MPILPVHKTSGAYQLLQDLCLINARVVPIQSVVPKLYLPLLSTSWHYLLCHPGSQGCFPHIPLCKNTYHLFALTWMDPDSSQSQKLTWTLLPMGLQDSPQFFSQVLAKDLLLYDQGCSNLLQYMGYLLLCTFYHEQKEGPQQIPPPGWPPLGVHCAVPPKGALLMGLLLLLLSCPVNLLVRCNIKSILEGRSAAENGNLYFSSIRFQLCVKCHL